MFTAFEGNLAADPELKTFDDGNASVRFRLINNPTSTDRRTGEIVKGTPVAMSCVARDPLARNIAAGCQEGRPPRRVGRAEVPRVHGQGRQPPHRRLPRRRRGRRFLPFPKGARRHRTGCCR